MNRTEIANLTIAVVKDFASTSERIRTLDEIDENTRLFGAEGIFDSLGLVSVILDVEQQVNEQLGTAIVLADERAMSQSRSPFRSIRALVDYISLLVGEQHQDRNDSRD